MTVLDLADLRRHLGEHLGYSSYHEITQAQVDLFADATGDHQWIHQDVARAADGPFGGTIAHGYLTLSLLPVLLAEIWQVTGVRLGVNYGANRVRFPSPVPVGSSLRAGATLVGLEDIDGGAQIVLDVVVQVRDAPKPSLVAQVLYRYYL